MNTLRLVLKCIDCTEFSENDKTTLLEGLHM